jgi:hypothetical protein
MPYPKANGIDIAVGSNITSQAFTNDPALIAENAKFVAHVTDKFQAATTPLIIGKEILFENISNESVSSFDIAATIGAKTKALFSAFGITQGRPEIIAVTDFEPVYKSNGISRTDAGELFDAQIKMRTVRAEKIIKFRDQLAATPTIAALLDDLHDDVIANVSSVLANGMTLVDVNKKTRNVERALDMHSAPTASKIKKIMKDIRDTKGVDFTVYTPKSMLADVFGFNAEHVDAFMSTKIILQLLSAFKATLNNYSTRLFDTKFSEVAAEFDSSVSEILPPEYQNNFQFTTKLLRGTDTPFDVLEWANFSKLYDAAPDDPLSRVALFLHTAARELRTSAGATQDAIAPAINAKTAGDLSRAFDVIIGEISANVFTQLPSTTTLAGLTKIDEPTVEGDVMPFEGHEIVYQNDTFVPAKTFIDTVKSFDGVKFNTAPLQSFTTAYQTTTNDSLSLIEKLLFVFDKSTMLNILAADSQMASLLSHVSAAVNIMGGGLTSTSAPWPKADQLLFMRAAAFDKNIKWSLFRLFIYQAAAPANLTNGSIWWHIKESIGSNNYTEVRDDFIARLKVYALGQSEQSLEADIDWATSRSWAQITSSVDHMFEQSGKTMPLNSARTIIQTLFSAASAQSLPGKGFVTDQHLTAFNHVHLTAIAYMIFDAYITLVDMFTNVVFFQAKLPEYIVVQTSGALNKASQQYLDIIPVDGESDVFEQGITDAVVEQNGGVLLKGQADLIYKKTVAQHYLNRLRFEESIVRSMVAMLRAISTNFKKEANALVSALDLTNDANKERLTFITDALETQTQVSLFDRTQISLITDVVERLTAALSSTFPPAFLNNMPYTSRHINVLDAWLKEGKLLNRHMRILSVGIPAGTMAGTLAQRIKMGSYEEFSAPLKLPRPVEVRVYAKNLEYPALVFEPKKFRFDVDRFVKFDDIDPVLDDPQITFDTAVNNIVQQVRASDMTLITSGKGTASANYGGEASEYSAEIVRNHLTSELFVHYVKLLSGVSITELDFPTNPNIIQEQHSNVSLAKLLLIIDNYLTDIAGAQLNLDDLKQTNVEIAALLDTLTTTQNIVKKTGAPINVSIPEATSKQLINLTEGIVNFLDTFSADSFLSDGSRLVDRILAPKLFERIFHVLVDPRDFVVDISATAATDAGNSFLTTRMNTLLIEDAQGDVRLNPEFVDITMHELFTTVSSLEAF